jgi:hypothetical protein
MKKEFVSYEQAKALKELGFNEPCYFAAYDGETLQSIYKQFISNLPLTAAPLKQQAFRWFREKHNLVHSITFKHTKDNVIKGINSVYYDIEIYTLQGGDAYKTYLWQECTNLYEEAEGVCINKLINIVKNK